MDNNIVVSVNNVSKQFVLPHEKKNSVKSIFTGMFKGYSKSTKQQALKDISFDIKEGEFFGIVGRNGSGKSTLLKIIAGIYQPTSGKVQVKGKLVPFIELGVGFNPELTGRENVYLNGAILGFSTKQTDKNYKEIVEFAELEDHMDQKLKNYSSGMQVRLAFACATMSKAEVLLVDEVLAVGDADFQRKCFNYFRTLKKLKKTVIFVTHDMSSVREYCDRAILIDDSKLMHEGRPGNIADEYSKLFINSSIKKDTSILNRQGNGLAIVSDFKKSIIISSKKEPIKIDFKVTAKQQISNPVIGFKLKNAADQPILGTNTLLENIKINNLNKNDSKTINIEIDNILNTGTYLVDLVIVSETGDVYDWIIEAIKIDVKTEKKTGYLVEPLYKLGVKDV